MSLKLAGLLFTGPFGIDGTEVRANQVPVVYAVIAKGGPPWAPAFRVIDVGAGPDQGVRFDNHPRREDDSVVFVSALAPTRNNAMLIDNLRMAEAVCAALAAQPVAHLVYVSSDAVYSDDANPVTERSCQQPSSLHGVMHLAREIMLRAALKLPLAILRPTLIYGAKDPHNGYGPNRFRRLAAKGEAITLFGEGEEKRDHILVDDVAAPASAVLHHRSKGVLNIATGRSASFRGVGGMIVG